MKYFVLLSLGFWLLTTCAWGQSVTIPVNSPAARFSPGNWAGDAGRGGSAFRVTWNNGAYCAFYWSTTSASPTATLDIADPTDGATVAYFLDGRLTDNVPVPASGGVPIAGLAGSGNHSLTVYTRSSPQTRRWDRGNAFTVTGLTLDAGSVPGAAPAPRPWVEIVGDSIAEGIMADNGRDSSLSDYSFLVGQGLRQAGFDSGVSACGYSGWLRPGDAHGDVPGFYAVTGSVDGKGGLHDDARSRWDKIDSRTSLLDSRGRLSGYGSAGQEPAAILLNYIVNEALSGSSLSDAQASVTQGLAALRGAAPNALIFVLVPPGLYDTTIYKTGPAYVAALKAGVAAYHAAHPRDGRLVVCDLGPDVSHALASPAYGGGVHPNAAGHAFLAPLVLQALLKGLSAAALPAR